MICYTRFGFGVKVIVLRPGFNATCGNHVVPLKTEEKARVI